MTGTVEKYHKKYGYGFIRAEDGSKVFFSYRDIVTEGHREAEVGDRVSFRPEQDRKGVRGYEVKIEGHMETGRDCGGRGTDNGVSDDS